MSTLKANFIILILFISFVSFGQGRSITFDELIKEYGLSTEYFQITTVKAANKNVFKNLSSTAIKPTDTIIIAKIDTFQNKLNIKNKNIRHTLVLSGKVFKKGISFNSSHFTQKVFMNECIFNDRVDFSHAIFDSTLIIWRTQFKKAGVFSNAIFNGLQFLETQFMEDVQFHEVHFNGATFFIKTNFRKGAYFTGAKFRDFISFNFSEFDTKPWFWQITSLDTMTFYSAKLNYGIDFQSSNFGLLLGLSHVESFGKIDFSDVSMPLYTELNSVKTNTTIDFNFINDSIKQSDYKINIYGVDLNNLMLTDRFTLYFDKYLSLDIKNGIYKELLDVLSKKGYKNVYKSFDIEYKQFMNENYNNFSERISYLVNRVWWNFGYSKQRVFLWTLIFIFIFSIPIRLKFTLFVDRVYSYEKLFERFNNNKNISNMFKRFLFDFWIAFIYTIFVFFNLKLDFDKLSFNNYLASAFILFIYVIGLICTAFIINLIITF